MIKVIKIFGIMLFVLTFTPIAFTQENVAADIDLERLINAALSNNPGIKDGLTKTEIRNTEINLSKSAILPRISTDVSYSVTNQNSLEDDFSSISTGLNLTQTLWENGKNKALIKQSEFLYKAKQSEFDAQKQELILQVKYSFFNLLRYKELCKISEHNVNQAELFLEAAKEKNKLGIGKYSDILKAESELADTKYLLKGYNYSLKDAENELERLTGITILADLIESNRINNVTTSYEVLERERLWEIAKINYPELKSLENIQQAQDYFIKAVKADFYPNVSANGGYNWYYNPIFNGQKVWSAGITIRWDLFDGNRRRSQVKIEQLRNQSYQYQRKDLLADLKNEIANKINALNKSQDQIEISKLLLKSTSENLKIVEEEYIQGISSMLELTNARTDNFNANAKLINAITDYELAKAQLERIIGVINVKTK